MHTHNHAVTIEFGDIDTIILPVFEFNGYFVCISWGVYVCVYVYICMYVYTHAYLHIIKYVYRELSI